VKKHIIKILIISLLIQVINITVSASSTNIKTAEESLDIANRFLEENVLGFYGYFGETNINGDKINEVLAVKGTPAFNNMPIFVYGSEEKASIDAVKKAAIKVIKRPDEEGVPQYRCLGYTINGDLFANSAFPPDYPPTQNVKTLNGRWVKEPWNHDHYYIKQWINRMDFTPEQLFKSTGRWDFFAANIVDGPEPQYFSDGGSVEDYVHIIQPPTMYSWGLGIGFYFHNNGRNLRYRTFLLMPFEMLNNDISVHAETIPVGAGEGKKVLVGLNVKSTFTTDETVDFEWEIIKKSDGSKIPVEYLGHATKVRGKLTIPGENERILYASFSMPEDDVSIRLAVNKDGTSPEEKYLGNNVFESEIKFVESIFEYGEYDIPYNALSRDLRFNLSQRYSVADLGSPRGRWSGSITGVFRVLRSPMDGLFRKYSEQNNPSINGSRSRVERNPIINTTIERKDFGDDPVGKKWLDRDPSSPVVRSGKFFSDGYIEGLDVYECGFEDCLLCPHSSFKTAPFNDVTKELTFNVYVYNGMRNIPEPRFKNEIENNRTDSLNKKMYWASEPHIFKVVRWMCHINSEGKEVNFRPVDGRYERKFIQQNSGDIQIKIKSPMEKEYQQAREAARNGINKKDLYNKAVFPTDIDLQRFDYPIKSGYYFNPAGTYSFKVETVTYKPVIADTQEHKDIVNAIINSFNYETDLMYINNDKEAVNIKGELLAQRGNSFSTRPGRLTAQDNIGINGIELVTVLDRNRDGSRYTKKVEEIYHEETSGGNTHQYWKMVMEGYAESNTLGSRDNYKYREYVKPGQKMYKITETTEVDIIINKDNINTFTHAHMPDGEYYIRVWMDNIDLGSSTHKYKSLGILSGALLDEMEITVKGSMYDD
jgi:hypothetical protein